MILVVGPNTALDHVVFVDHLTPGTVRTTGETWSVGGGGANVARVLRRLGAKVRLIGLLGGPIGEEVRMLLEREGGEIEGVPVSGNTRVDTAILEHTTGTTNLLVSVGPEVTEEEWRSLDATVRRALAARPDIAVLTGSLPPKVPASAYRDWVLAARELGVPVAVDASGAALRLAADGIPDILKMTQAEWDEAFSPGDGAGGPGRAFREGVAELLRRGIREVVVTRGADGAQIFTTGATYTAPALTVPRVRTTLGCGDAFMAGLALRYVEGASVPAQLTLAIALGALTLESPGADLPEGADPLALESQVRVEVTASVLAATGASSTLS